MAFKNSLSKADLGLGNVDNTSDLNKPISSKTQTALDLKADKSEIYTKTELDNKFNNLVIPEDYVTESELGNLAYKDSLSKTDIGLGNVDNTSDLNKPISTATQTALNLKANQSDLTSGLASKQDKLSETQLEAVNSGITKENYEYYTNSLVSLETFSFSWLTYENITVNYNGNYYIELNEDDISVLKSYISSNAKIGIIIHFATPTYYSAGYVTNQIRLYLGNETTNIEIKLGAYRVRFGYHPMYLVLAKDGFMIVNQEIEKTQYALYSDSAEKSTYVTDGVEGGTSSQVVLGDGSLKAISDIAPSTDLSGYYTSSEVDTKLDTKLDKTGGNISGHIYLTGSKPSSSTGNTSQIVFGTSSTQHVVLSSNDNTLVINPTTTTTTNQIVLCLDKQSQFPSGITSGGTINAKILQENGTTLSSKYQTALGYTPVNKAGDTIEGDLTVSGWLTTDTILPLNPGMTSIGNGSKKLFNTVYTTFLNNGAVDLTVGNILQKDDISYDMSPSISSTTPDNFIGTLNVGSGAYYLYAPVIKMYRHTITIKAGTTYIIVYYFSLSSTPITLSDALNYNITGSVYKLGEIIGFVSYGFYNEDNSVAIDLLGSHIDGGGSYHADDQYIATAITDTVSEL